jgi:hypothetical protein
MFEFDDSEALEEQARLAEIEGLVKDDRDDDARKLANDSGAPSANPGRGFQPTAGPGLGYFSDAAFAALGNEAGRPPCSDRDTGIARRIVARPEVLARLSREDRETIEHIASGGKPLAYAGAVAHAVIELWKADGGRVTKCPTRWAQ